MTNSKKTDITITNKENSQVSIKGTLSLDILEAQRKLALKNLGENLKIDGFRPGNIPTEIIEKQLGETTIFEEMAQLALSLQYSETLNKEKIDAIGRPNISITKLAPGNPVEFEIITDVLPAIELSEYKKIAKKVNKKEKDTAVSEKELEEAITQLRKFRAQATLDEEKAKQAKEKGEQFSPTKIEDIKESDLPEITEEYVKTLGNFKTVEEFKQKLKDNLTEEKAKQAKEKAQMETIEEIIKETKIDLPRILIEHEIDRSMAQLEHDIAMSGLEFDKYLESIKKTKEEVRKDMEEVAIKKSKMRLIVEAIAKKENLMPTQEEMTKEVKNLMEMYKDNKNASEEGIKAYVAEIMLNQKVIAFLEEL